MDRHFKPRVLVIGNAAHLDFADARAELRRSAQVWFIPNGNHAAAWLRANRPVDWIVLAQSRPGELPRDIVTRLQPLSDRANFVSLLGSWCEGELRTGHPWPDVPRCYWYAFPSWWRATALGATGSASAAPVGPIALSTVDYESATALLDALGAEGLNATWWPRHRTPPLTKGISAGIWVGGQLNGQEAVQLDAFCKRLRSDRALVVALLDFPRRDRVELAKRIGAAVVLGKPWLTGDLAHVLRDLIDRRATGEHHELAIRFA